MIIRGDPERPLDLNPSLPLPLVWTIERCLSKDPADRYTSTRDLARDLQTLRDHSGDWHGLDAPRLAPRIRRPRLLVAAVAIAAALGVAGTAVYFATRAAPSGPPGTAPAPTFHQLTFRRGLIQNARFAPDGQTIIYAAGWDGGQVRLFEARLRAPDSRPIGPPSAGLASRSGRCAGARRSTADSSNRRIRPGAADEHGVPGISICWCWKRTRDKCAACSTAPCPEPVLDLAVNNASERGLLGIAVDPDFPCNRGVYLSWSCRTAGPASDRSFPGSGSAMSARCRVRIPTTSSPRPSSATASSFVWTGLVCGSIVTCSRCDCFRTTPRPSCPIRATKNSDRAPIMTAAYPVRRRPQLYVLFGDAGRRGQLQDLPSGPTQTGLGAVVADDQFGGPAADDAHLSGVIQVERRRQHARDNPFVAVGQRIGGPVGRNIQRIFVYGIRNSFGMAIDPRSGRVFVRGERRRRLRRDQPRDTGDEQRMDLDDGAGRARARLQADQNHIDLQ